MIDVTSADLVTLVKHAYALSRPKGLGFIDYVPDVLTDADAQALIRGSRSASIAVSLDYVKGRGVKLTVFQRDDRREIPDTWYDHTTEQLAALLECVKVAAPSDAAPHNVSCECSACERARAAVPTAKVSASG